MSANSTTVDLPANFGGPIEYFSPRFVDDPIEDETRRSEGFPTQGY
jgi:hypothetical protein